MQKAYEDATGNTRCLTCGSKIEGGYCDCMAYEVQDEKNQEAVRCSQETKLTDQEKMVAIAEALANCFNDWDDALMTVHDLLEAETDVEVIRKKAEEFAHSVLCITESIIAEKSRE